MISAVDTVQDLPPLPVALQRLIHLTQSPETSFEEIARTAEMDHGLGVRMLRAANSAYYGLSRQVKTVSQATILLGRNTVRNLALSLSVLMLRDRMDDSWPLQPGPFWEHTLATGSAARALARHLRLSDPDEAFVAGLLHDVGKVILAGSDREGYGRLIARARAEQRPLHLLEREVYGVDHASVGASVCRRWQLPDSLANAVAMHHGSAAPASDERAVWLANLTFVGNRLAKTTRIGDSGSPLVGDSWSPWRHTPPQYQIPHDAVAVALEQMREDVEQARQAFMM